MSGRCDRTAFQPQRFRVATPEEAAQYGGSGCRRQGLLPPIGGGAYALVGSLGAVSTATSPVTPAFGQSPTAGNLLICWGIAFAVASAPTLSAGWTAATTEAANCGVGIWYKIAAGGDTAPTVTNVGQTISTQLGEFSGNATSSPVDQTGSGESSVSNPFVITAAAADAAVGELFVYCWAGFYSTAATKTLATTPNNTTAHDTTNNGSSTVDHYAFGYGITTTNSAADNASCSATATKLTDIEGVVASFLLPGAQAPPFLSPNVIFSHPGGMPTGG